MELVILVIHVFLAVAIIGVVLLQPPESSSLGGLGGANPMAGSSTRGQGNILTRMTAIFATGFIITSLILALISGQKPKQTSILDEAAVPAVTQEAPVEKAADKPAAKKAPSVPLSQ